MSGVLALALAVIFAAGDPKPPDPLIGSWVVTSTTIGGAADPQLAGHTATFGGGKLTFRSKDGTVHSGDYVLNTSASPAAIDFVPADGPRKGKTLRGIFAVDGDELRICLGKEGEPRPTTFANKAGEQAVLLALTRDRKR